MPHSVLKVLLPLLVLMAGAGATAALISLRKTPERVERPAVGPLVEVRQVETTDVRVEVDGQGEVSPQVKVHLAPQVTGRVVKVHPSLVSGGRFRAGETLVEIDPRDYELAVERARAAVAGAETVLLREQAEGDAAAAEWREVHADAAAPTLLVREPQIREAEARLAAARADLAGAELSLERTRLSLPFDGLVLDEQVDVGQLVTSGQQVATICGTRAVEIRVPLDDRELAWFDVPGFPRRGTSEGTPRRGTSEGTPRRETSGGTPRRGTGEGTSRNDGRNAPRARVSTDFAGARHTWYGQVDRLEGQVDTRSRMVRVVVVVEAPFSGREGRPPLLPGIFVDVTIEGRELEDVVVIPRYALREGHQVWVVEDNVLDVRDVRVLRQERDKVYIGSGLETGESLVVSSLDAVTDGMTVRTDTGGEGGTDHV